MKPTHLSLDTKKLEQPQGTYPYGKNGVRNANLGADENENGFLPSSSVIPYKVNGIIETDTYPVYFSTDNVNSAFGFHDTDQDIYIPIFDDASTSFKLNFNINHPIKGEYRRNFRNEIELSWLELDAGTGTIRNPPRWANTVRIGTDPNDFLLFPKSLIPYVETTMQPNGNLGMGAYYFGVKYIKTDGTETRYTTLTRPLIAFSDNYDTIPGTNTGKAIRIDLTGLDQTYDRIGIAVVERINGVDSAYLLPELPIAPTVSFIYTGTEKQTQITIEEVLIPAAYYENAEAITQLSDQLFLGDMVEEPVIDWQQYASMIKIRWKSELAIPANRPSITTESGKQRGFMHEEVYAFYGVLKLRSGRSSRAFIIPGPEPLSSDLLQSTRATAQTLTAKVFQVEDTCRNISGNTGDCGVWVNQDETYPDIIQFDSSALGGENLRGQPVRHHRFPSIRFCKQNLYASEQDYARTKLDTLGLEVSNVIIPASLQNQVIGWEIFYARRDFNNATVQGQSLLLFGAQANQDTGAGNVVSTGGNWGSYQRTRGSGSTTDPESLRVTNDHIRMHPFDLLYFRPSISPSHLSIQLYELITGYNVAFSNPNQTLYDLDYTNGLGNVQSPAVPAIENWLYRLSNTEYITNNLNSGDFNNIRQEDAFVAKIPQPGPNLMNALGWSWAKRDYTNAINNDPAFVGTYLANLMTIRRNVYLSFFSQALVRTGQVFPATVQASTAIIYGGDTFVSEYGFITYGLVTRLDVVDDTGRQDWKTGPNDGIKVNWLFVCETVGNVACRYENPGNGYSKFWPKSSMANGTNSFLYGFSRNVSPNQIGYSKDCNAVGDLLNGILPASPYDQFVQSSPNKIIRSEKQLSESKVNSWKNFNALDYYETVKNKGPIVNLCGMNDRLIIHTRDAIFITRSKATFESDITQVTLGTGDIFQFEPNEVRPARLGYGGTSNPLACMLTTLGYIYPDNLTGELLLFDGATLTNIGAELVNFFLKYLTVKEINNYIGNGIIIGYEQAYKRILLTVKNTNLSGSDLVFVPNFQPTVEFFEQLTPDVSVVYKDGRYQLFKGVNSSEFECDSTLYPTLDDYEFSSDEHVPNGTSIGTVTAIGGVGPYTYIITTTDKAGLTIDPLTGEITVQDSLAFDYTESVLSLTVKVTDADGNTATGTVDVTINQVSSIPVLPAYSVTIPELSANGTSVQDENATDRDGKSITYSIVSGNGDSAFAINSSTGIVTVANGSLLTFAGTNPRVLTIRATASDSSYAENTLTVYLSYVHQAPLVTDVEFSIADTLVNGSVVGLFTAATQPAGQLGELIYELDSDSTPAGAFSVELDTANVDFRKIKVLDNTKLDPLNNDYVTTIKVYDLSYPADISTFTITITVFYDPELLTAEEYEYTCVYTA